MKVALAHNPTISTNGLVLCLDAANPKSFRGEPTENLISSTGIDMTQLSSYSSLSRSQVTEPLAPPGFACEMTIDDSSINPASRVRFGSSGNIPSNGSTFISVWVKIHSGPYSNIIPAVFAGSGWRNLLPLDGKSQFLTYEYRRFGAYVPMGTSSGGPTPGFSMTQSNDNIQSGQKTRWHSPQVEEKPYPTPFVDGVRGATVETGGGWADLSKNTNHGGLVNGVQFDNDNKGSLVFDGVDDSIVGDLPFVGNKSEFSVSVWTKAISRNNSYDGIIQVDGTGTGNYIGGIIISFSSSNTVLRIRHWNDGGTNYTWSSNLIGNWRNIVLTIKNNQILVYDNGEVVVDSTYTNDFDFNGSYRVGHYTFSSNYYNGYVSNAHIYNRALSPEEIRQNYNALKGRYGL